MLTLFPQYRIALGVGWLATAATAGWMLQSGAAWYWIAALELGMALSAQGKAKESELILRRAAGGNPALWSVRQAGALLAQLPVKTDKKKK